MTSSTAKRGRGGRGGGKRGKGKGWDGTGGEEERARLGITGFRLPQQDSLEVGCHRAVAHGSRSWGDLRREGKVDQFNSMDTVTWHGLESRGQCDVMWRGKPALCWFLSGFHSYGLSRPIYAVTCANKGNKIQWIIHTIILLNFSNKNTGKLNFPKSCFSLFRVKKHQKQHYSSLG